MPPDTVETEESKPIARKPNTPSLSDPVVRRVVITYLILLRILNAFTTATFFQPDEFYQSLEPAHKLIFNTGYLTWEWRTSLRSFLHPLMFAGVYKLSQLFDFGDYGVIYGPKILSAILAGIGDYHTYLFIRNASQSETMGNYGIFISVTSAFNWYCSTRSFSNTLETILTTIALAYWPWRPTQQSIKWCQFSLSLFTSAISCIIRPNNGLIWLYLGLVLLYRLPTIIVKVKVVLLVLAMATISIGLNSIVDYYYYGKFVFPIWEFLKFNIVEQAGDFYGVAPWHFYLFQGIPILLVGYLPITIYECFTSWRSQFFGLLIFIISIYSFIGHKEFRFIYPLLPIFHLFTAKFFSRFSLPQSLKFKILTGIIIINTAVAVYFTQIHERGVMDLMEYLRHDIDVSSIGLLMPCHSTPWQSHLHRDDLDDYWFLSCEPPLW